MYNVKFPYILYSSYYFLGYILYVKLSHGLSLFIETCGLSWVLKMRSEKPVKN